MYETTFFQFRVVCSFMFNRQILYTRRLKLSTTYIFAETTFELSKMNFIEHGKSLFFCETLNLN